MVSDHSQQVQHQESSVRVPQGRQAHLFSVKTGSQALEESLLDGPPAFPF